MDEVGEMQLRILIVDDIEINRRIEALMARKLGHQADLAENGNEAIEALKNKSYDIVLMDIQMPEKDGLETTKIIREKWPNGPRIIIVTSQDVNCDTCLDAGASEFLLKPLRVETLRDAIERNMPIRLIGIGYEKEITAICSVD